MTTDFAEWHDTRYISIQEAVPRVVAMAVGW